MKRIVLVFSIVLTTIFGCQSQPQKTLAPAGPYISFNDTIHDFGTVNEGTMATYEFKFKNTGNEPVVLQNVQASCGCTTPDWSKEPIAPNQDSKITVKYNSQGRPGSFNKTITITSNAKRPVMTILTKGTVEPKKEEQKKEEPKKN